MSDNLTKVIEKNKKFVNKNLKQLELIEQGKWLANGYELGYIYLIREIKFVIDDEDVYKIGFTIQKTPTIYPKRLSSYGKDSELIFVRSCNAKIVNKIETKIKKIFSKTFEKHSRAEYFAGDPEKMIDIINKQMDLMRTEKVKLLREEKELINTDRLISRFIGDTLVETKCRKHIISVVDLYNLFEEWSKTNCKYGCLAIKCLRNYLELDMDRFIDKKDILVGHKLKTDDGVLDELNNIKRDKIMCFNEGVNVDDFSVDDILEALEGDAMEMALRLVKMIYFNDTIKKYHNVYSTNKGKNGHACILTIDGVKTVNKHNIIFDIRMNMLKIVEQLLLKYNDKKYELDRIKELITSRSDKEGYEKELHIIRGLELIDEIVLLIYNYRKIVMETHKNNGMA